MMTRPAFADLPRHGTLEEAPYAHLLVALAEAEATVILELRRNQLQKTIVFADGWAVDCRSNIATEMLGRFLASTGKVREADANAAFAVAASRGVPLGEILTERGLLTSSELYRVLQQNLGRKLLEPFSWTSGTYLISEDVPPVASVLRVKVPQLLLTGIQKVEPQENADEAAAAAIGKYLALTPDPAFLDELRLTTNQQKVVDAARQGRRFDELAAEIDVDDLHRSVYALLLLGVIDTTFHPRPQAPRFELDHPFTKVEEDVPVEVSLDSIETEPEPPPIVALTPMPAHEPPETVLSAFLSYRRKDAFELLEIEETAGASAIVKAYLAMADRFLPSRFPEIGPDGLREKAQQVFLAAARAYTELADPTRREALVKRREMLRNERQAAAKAGAAAMIDPEALWKSGVNLAAAGNLREALSSFELAAECDAQNGTYAAEAAWCRFRLNVTPAANALKLLKNAIRIDPQCGVAYLYAGQVQAVLGKRVEAEGYLSRAAALLPNDSRPAAAMKALR
ncbi:MAG TPA: DUF4388 domain-containing protein [Thermoanaerobaculia bacterium]|nr:DUF4388 domain-containing protein [Thermoanaerobaculia bacterium]